MNAIPDLEERFLAPAGWETADFENEDTGHRLHFGYGAPEGEPKATVILLQGLQEFSEKYYETARFFIENGYAIAILEWQYQGRSGRLESNPHKRHSDGFETDVDDLKRFIEEHVRYLFPDTDLHMLAHSTGANIGLHYLLTYPEDFKSANLSAPLIGVHGLSFFPDCFIMGLISILKIFPMAYVPGGRNWREDDRPSDGTDKFSSDPARDAVTNAWYLADPSLQGGNPTISWLYHAYQAMSQLKTSSAVEDIRTPLLFGIGDNDTIVCSDESEKLAARIPSAEVLHLKNAKHEILMETDDIRDSFLHMTLKNIEKAA